MMRFGGPIDRSVPGTANYRPGSAPPDYRALIAAALAGVDPNDPSYFNGQRLDEVTSDPVTPDKTLGDIYSDLSEPGFPANDDIVADPTGRGLTNDQNVIAPAPLNPPAPPDTLDDQGRPVEPDFGLQNAPAPPAFVAPETDFSDALAGNVDAAGLAGAAIAADVGGTLAGLNAGVNDAVAGMGFSSDQSGAPGEGGPGGGGGGDGAK
jgi:hypothetical protein